MDWRESRELSDVLESPIERRLVGALLAAHEAEEANIRFVVRESRADELPSIRDREKYPGFWLHIFPQEPIGPYRADFLAIVAIDGRAKSLVIECDGRDFHRDWEKDFDRDLFMRRLDYGVIRLSGSDIYNHPRTCRNRIIEKAREMLIPAQTDGSIPAQQPLYPDTMRHLCVPLRIILPMIEWNYVAEEVEREKTDREES